MTYEPEAVKPGAIIYVENRNSMRSVSAGTVVRVTSTQFVAQVGKSKSEHAYRLQTGESKSATSTWSIRDQVHTHMDDQLRAVILEQKRARLVSTLGADLDLIRRGSGNRESLEKMLSTLTDLIDLADDSTDLSR